MQMTNQDAEFVLDFSTKNKKSRSISPATSIVTSTTVIPKISPTEISMNQVVSLEQLLSSPKAQYSLLPKSSPQNFDSSLSPPPVFLTSASDVVKNSPRAGNLTIRNPTAAPSFSLDEFCLQQQPTQRRWADDVSTAAASLALSALYNRRRRRPSRTTSASDNDSYSRNQQKTTTTTQKDEAYWDKRRKNNQAAKRSRDARKMKENEIAVRAAILEQENCKLKAEVNVLKNEMNRLHYIIFQQSHQKKQ